MDSDLNQDLAAHCGTYLDGYENENSSVTISVRPWFPWLRRALLNLIPSGKQIGPPA